MVDCSSELYFPQQVCKVLTVFTKSNKDVYGCVIYCW